MKAEVIDRLKAQLLISGIQKQNPALFQVINLLIDAARDTASTVQAATGGGGGGGVGVLSQSFVTTGLEQGTLANSRQIRAGSGVTIMDSGVGLVVGAAPIPMFGESEEPEAYIPLPGPQGPIGPVGPAGSGGGVLMPLPIDPEFCIPDIGLPFGTILDVGFIAYTPVINSGITLGDGTIVGTAYQIGRKIFFTITFTFGTTSAITGTPNISLPAPVAAGDVGNFFGNAAMTDADGGVWLGVPLLSSTTALILRKFTPSGANVFADDISSTVPFTWATGDTIRIVGEMTRG